MKQLAVSAYWMPDGKRQRIVALALPLLALIVVALFGVRIKEPVSFGLMAIFGITSVLLFIVAVQMAHRVQAWADTRPTPGHRTRVYGDYLRELVGRAAAICLTAMVATACYVWVVGSRRVMLRISSDTAVLVTVYLVVLLATFITSIVRLTDERIRAATSGADLVGEQE
ncbi:MAG: hypothetical protein ACYCU8_01105 [Ferrimicrobium acidiphilum]